MPHSTRVFERKRLALAWPSIASASAQLGRPRHLRAVPDPAEKPAVLGYVAPLRAAPSARQRNR